MPELKDANWIQTMPSGLKVFPLNLDPRDVRIEDIARALSNICRYNGHVESFYSVAQHSFLVSRVVSPENAVHGLLHDAAEAYLGDIVRPLKSLLYVNDYHGPYAARLDLISTFRQVEDKCLLSVYDGLGVDRITPQAEAEIKHADKILLCTEIRDLRRPIHPDNKYGPSHGYPTLEETIVPLPPAEAEEWFLKRWDEVRPK